MFSNSLYFDEDYQHYNATTNCLVRIDYNNTESYYAEYVFSFNPGPGPDEPITPVTPKNALYYKLGYTVQQIDACGTFSSKYKVNTSSYFGECKYREFKASEDYNENGSSYPIIQTDKTATFIYYDNEGHENYLTPIEGSKTVLVNNMVRRHKTGRQYPYTDGWYWCGSHVSAITLTVQLPDGSTKTIWGLIEEEDEFGGLWSYGY